MNEVLAALWQRKGVIILVTTAMLLATILVVNRIPDIYESRGLVIVSAAAADSPVVISQITAASQELSSQHQLTALVRKYPLYPGSKSDEEAMQTLSKVIKTEVKQRGYYPDGPESFKISYRHPDPKLAQQVVGDLVELFNKSNETTKKQAAQDLQTLGQELTEVEGQLQKLAALARQQGKTVESSPKVVVDSAAVQATQITTREAIGTLNDKQFGLEQQIAMLKKQIADQQKLVRQTAPPSPGKSAQGPLLVRKAELEADLTKYTSQYTEKHPKVIETRTKLGEVNRQLAALQTAPDSDESPVASIEAQNLRALMRELTRLESDLEVTRRDVARKQELLTKLPTVDPTAAYKKTETTAQTEQPANIEGVVYSNYSERYRTLLARREGLQKVLNGTGVFQILDYPVLAQTPVGPNRLLYKLLGGLAGLLIGLGVAFALELPRLTRIQDERDVDYLLGAPVLALIPETLTPAESVRVQRLHLARGILVLMLVGGLIPAIYFLLKGIGVLQLLGGR
jgi:uncharacterized protein involved in exopolysaccharide biosynthesis